MKHMSFFKKLLVCTLVVGFITLSGTGVKADTTPPGTIGGATVVGRSTCGLNNASASTYSSSYDPYVYAKVKDVDYHAKHPVTGADYFNNDNSSSGQSSASVSFVAPSGYASVDISADHEATKYGQPWSGHTYESY